MACSPELQALWKHFHDLQCSIHHPVQLAEQLAVEASAVNLVPTDVKEQICSHGGTVAEKTRLLILRIEQGVASNPVAFHFFLSIISKHPSLATIAGQLRTSFAQQTLGNCVPVEGGESVSNSERNDGVGVCLTAGSSASVQNTLFDTLNIGILYDELSTVSDWFQLGLKLGVPDYKLDEIQQSYPSEGCSRWKLEALKLWLQLKPNATWMSIVRALQRMEEIELAKRIRKKYMRRESTAENVPIHEGANSDSKKMKSVLREDESSHGSTVYGTPAGLSSALAVQPSFQKLSSSQQDELLAKLYDDEESIKLRFGSLLSATCNSVQNRVSVDVFRASILSMRAYEQALEVGDRSLLEEESGEIETAKSVTYIFAVLTPYWNYLNFEILKYIITEHGTSDDYVSLRNYDGELKKFCERKILELPMLVNGSDVGNTFPNQVKCVIKFDKPESMTGNQLLQIREQIANIFHVNVTAFKICRVEVGCVQLTFLIPKFVPQDIFPLSCEQTSALSKNTSVIRLECGPYVLKSTCTSNTENAATQSTASLKLEELEDKSQFQKEPCAEEPRQTVQHVEGFIHHPGQVTSIISPATVGIPYHHPLPVQSTVGNLVEVLAETVRAVYCSRPEVHEDCWPPVKKSQYINLALTENESIDFRNDFSRYTVRGSVDDILKNKNKITYSDIFENTVVGSRILLEGRPGSGKTTLMNKISRDWAQRVILNSLVSLLILVPLRQLAGKTEVTLETLLSFFPDDKAQELGQHIRSIAGEGICFALDGLDEYSSTKGRLDFIFELIKRNCLPRSIVIVASRPAASQKFRCHADQSIEVLGFLRPQIRQFISEYYAPNEELAQELQLYLDHHPNILHMCYLPVHLAIVTFLFSILGAKLPETETEIYEQFTLQSLIRTQLKAEVEVDANVTLESFEDLPPEQYQSFCGICELALNATVNQKQGFTHEEVKDFLPLEKSLGLITVDRQLMLYGPTNTYSFLHLTFQQFLAACHLTFLSKEKQHQLVSRYHERAHMHVVCKFFCGLTKLKSEGDLKCFQSIISDAPPCTLLHLHCTYESQSEIACHTLISACNGMFALMKEVLTPSDWSAIVFIITRVGVQLQGINFESCHIYQKSLESLAKLDSVHLCSLKSLSLSGTKMNDPTVAKALACFMEKAQVLSSLRIDRCGLRNKTFFEVAPSLIKLNHLEVLSIHHNSLSAKGRKFLKDTLKEMIHLMELDIDIDDLESSGVYELYQLCKSLETVRLWRKQLLVEVIASSPEEAVVRMHEIVQPDGSLCVRGLGVVLRQSGFSRLQFQRERSVYAGMKESSLECVKIEVNLAFEGIGDESCIILGTALREYKELHVLNLFGNNIRDDNCTALLTVLNDCKELQVLNLRWNNLTDVSISPLTKLIKSAASLETLDLTSNQFTMEGKTMLQQAAEERKSCPDLHALHLNV